MVRVKSAPNRLSILNSCERIDKWPLTINKKLTTKPCLKQRRYRPGELALRHIRKYYQHKSNFLFPRSTFDRLTREITQENLGFDNVRFQATAMNALQEAAETFLVNLFEDAHQCSLHAHRVTLFLQDLTLVRRLRASSDNSKSF